MNNNYIIKTDYFNSRGLGSKEVLRFLLAILVLYLVDLYELEPGSNILTGGLHFYRNPGRILFVLANR